jgi:asparagine synthase (glutamine-hydrolysing)
MCGIAGIVQKDPFNPSILQSFSKILLHRGPDDEGYMVIAGNDPPEFLRGATTIPECSELKHISAFDRMVNIGFMHRRLSIIDLTAKGHQPMTYGDRLIICFNGEIYNYKELKAELIRKGYQFTTDSDTEVVMAAFMEWGMRCVHKFLGMWAFALYDRKTGTLHLSRDRFGIKPLYYIKEANSIMFASEVKAFIMSGIHPATLDLEYTLEWFVHGSSELTGHTYFGNVTELLPGTNLLYHYQDGIMEIDKYYDLTKIEYQHLNSKSDAELIDDFGKLIHNSISFHARSDVEVGSCLSGGIDSSTIVINLSSILHYNKIKTFTASYDDPLVDESSFAKVLGNYKNIDQYFIFPNAATFWEDFDRLIWYQDFPFHSSSIYAQWEVMKLAASQHIKVILDGQGADEILCGYPQFVGAQLLDLLIKFNIWGFVKTLRDLNNNYKSSNPYVDLGRAYFHTLPKSLKKRIYKNKRLSPKLIKRDYYNQISHLNVPERICTNIRDTSINQVIYNLHDLLRYEDRNSMAFSVESRVPYLDHRVVEFAINLPDSLKIKEGWTKYILRMIIDKKLPEQLVWRKDKKGFITPEKAWFRNLSKYIKDYTFQAEFPDFLNKKLFLEMLENDITDTIHLTEIWKVLSFLKWYNRFIILKTVPKALE